MEIFCNLLKNFPLWINFEILFLWFAGYVFVGDCELFKFSRRNSKFIFPPSWIFKIQFSCLNLDAISRKCFLLNFSLIRYSLGLFRCYYSNRMSGKFFNFLFDVNFVFFAPGRLKEIWRIFRGIEKIWGILKFFVGSLESFRGKMFGKKTWENPGVNKKFPS